MLMNNKLAQSSNSTEEREALIRSSIDIANTNALRMALYQHTRDPELVSMTLSSKPIRGGALMMKTVADSELEKLKEKAVRLLAKGPLEPAPPPSREETEELLKVFAGRELTNAQLRFAVEQLGFEDFPRDVKASNVAPATLSALRVIVIGGGIAGIAAAVQLKRLGIPFLVLERQPDLGGVWELNNYPEARVDVSSFVYQFTFEKNYPWKDFFAPRDETKRYLHFVANKHGVISSFRFNTAVKAARWDETNASWTVTSEDAHGNTTDHIADFVITATGLFATPKIPAIDGIETFRGKMFHTTAWDHDFDYRGKRVAVVGTGSTGVQLTRAIAKEASQLTVFQRTPNWIVGIDGYRAHVPPEARFLLDALPYYWNWYCFSHFDAALQLQNAQAIDPEWKAKYGGVNESNDMLRKTITSYIQDQLASRPDLIEKCVPSYAPMGRRLVVDNGFFESLLRPNVELVTGGIQQITPNGIVDSTGAERAFDLIVLGAGFHVEKYLYPIEFSGRDGMTLDKAWDKDGPRSYLGLTMPSFPNLFMMYGPQSQPRSGGFYAWAEIWARYSVSAIVETIASGHRIAEIREDVFDEYNVRIDEAAKNLIWETEGAGSYFNNRFGRSQIHIPFATEEYHEMVAELELSDFHLR